jgi:hypothetical protein
MLVTIANTGDEQGAAAHPCAAAELRQAAADDDRGIEPGPIEHQPGHRRGRGLAVRTGDGDARLPGHQLRQQLAAQHHRNSAPARFDDLGVGRPHR